LIKLTPRTILIFDRFFKDQDKRSVIIHEIAHIFLNEMYMNHPVEQISFEKIQSIVEQTIGNLSDFCFLLGSAATPRFREDSDIDVAVFWRNGDIDFDLKLKIMNELEDKLGHDIDLISLNNIDIIYGIQVVDKGRLLFNTNPGLMLEWKAKQLSRYPDFKASRAIIENNILNRKKYV
jgi:predicted nucleotidyltransferase